jgi:Enoyl-CoA hydratase/isomerase
MQEGASTTSGERVTIEIADGVAEVTLNRPDKLNALDPAMFQAIIAAGESLSRTAGVRVVVLTGAGKGFCAGLDKLSFEAMAGGGAGQKFADIVTRTHGIANAFQQAAYVWRLAPVQLLRRSMGSHWAAAFRSPLAPTSAMSRRTRASRLWKSDGALFPTWRGLRSCANSPAPM